MADSFVLKRQAINSMRRLPMVNLDEVRNRVKYMTPEELRWTINATIPELRQRARLNADRLTEEDIPLNPWWYK